MGLPEDLEIDPATGVITGTITTGMRRAVRLEVATDRGTFARVIWLNTSDGNPPTLITLSAAAAAGGPVTLMENSPVGTLVGTLDVTDPDPGDSHALYVSVIAGSQNPYCLGISGNQLVVAGSTGIDYEFGQHLLTIRVRAYDTAENFRDEMFAISLLDDRTEDADGDGFSEAMEEDVFFTSDTSFTKFSTHDADKDGVPSLLEYAFNLDMKKPDAGLYLGGEGSTAGLPVTRVVIDPEGNPRLRMEYLKRIDSGLGYHPQFSGGLNSAAWADAPGPVVESPAGEGWIRCVVDDTQFTPAPPLRFGRVRVSR